MKRIVVLLLAFAVFAAVPMAFAQDASVKETVVKGPDSGFVLGDGVVEEVDETDIFVGESAKRCSGSCGGVKVAPWTCPKGQNCFLNCTTRPPSGSCV